MRIKQLKLVTGDEVICKVVEDGDDIVIKDALMIVCRYTDEDNRYYSFRTFMTYQDDPDSMCIIKSSKLVAYCNPTDELIREYEVALTNLYEMAGVTKKVRAMMSRAGDSSDSNVINLFTSDDGQVH